MQQRTVLIDLHDQLNRFRANVCLKHVELILKINKYCYLLHLVGLDFITLPSVKMHGQTQIKCEFNAHPLLRFNSVAQVQRNYQQHSTGHNAPSVNYVMGCADGICINLFRVKKNSQTCLTSYRSLT
jgi:hypothetical protein